MMSIDYQSILNSDNIQKSISEKRDIFIKDFLDELVNTNIRIDKINELIEKYDAYWNSIADIIEKQRHFCDRDVVKQYIRYSAHNYCCCDSRFKGGNYNG